MSAETPAGVPVPPPTPPSGPSAGQLAGQPASQRREVSVAVSVTVLALVLILVAAVVANAVHASRADGDEGAVAAAVAPVPPGRVTARNAIVFLVDDMSDIACDRVSTYLPRSSQWLGAGGTCYEHATVATPVCCPARAQVMTGQLAHNNRVRTQKAASLLRARETVQRRLGRAGVSTYGVGKYLNGVRAQQFFRDRNPIDNGFDDFDFWNSYSSEPGSFPLFDHGVRYLPDDGLSSTETNGAFGDAFLDRSLRSGRRFFLYDAFFAPHKQLGGGSALADLPYASPEHADDPVPPFRFNPEPDASDKLPLFSYPPPRSRGYYRALRAARVRALLDVDDEMAEVFARLEQTGVLDDTMVIFASDNGLADRGQVNWDGKAIPYPAAVNVPMLAWYPGAEGGVVDERQVSLIDIAPTLYDAMGVRPGHLLDGHSLLGDHEREVVYGEYAHETSSFVLFESGRETTKLPSWRVIRRGEESYVEWYRDDGTIRKREYYRDPEMTRNLLYPPYGQQPSPGRIRELHALMQYYAACEGTVEQGSRTPCT